jgi:hypothetical protein
MVYRNIKSGSSKWPNLEVMAANSSLPPGADQDPGIGRVLVTVYGILTLAKPA